MFKMPADVDDNRSNAGMMAAIGLTISQRKLDDLDTPDSKRSMSKLDKNIVTASRFKDVTQPLDYDRCNRIMLRSSRRTRQPLPRHTVLDVKRCISSLRRDAGYGRYVSSRVDVLQDKICGLTDVMNKDGSIADMIRFVAKDHNALTKSEKYSILKKYSSLQGIKFSDFDLDKIIDDKKEFRKLLTNKLQKIESEVSKIRLSVNRSKESLKLQINLISKIRQKVALKQTHEQEMISNSVDDMKMIKINKSIKSVFDHYEKTLDANMIMKKKVWEMRKEQYVERGQKLIQKKHQKPSLVSPSLIKVINWTKPLDTVTKLK